jgi:hypothetical protein
LTDWFNMFPSQYFFRKYCIKIVLVKLYFYQSFVLSLDPFSWLGHIKSTPTLFKFFLLENMLETPENFYRL